MRVINAVIGFILLTLTVLHFFVPNHIHLAALYGAGAALAFISLAREISIRTARLLAIGTTAVMFFYFAGFFKMAPHLHENWYTSGAGLEGVGMLLSAFAMIPVLSCYSCLLKADCRETHMTVPQKRAAFFSVPENVQEKSF
ncbi:MAG: hypothetical protein AAF993_09615 [Pseudomonadota bacterium]